MFDLFCRHIHCEDDGWIFTNSKEIILLFRQVTGMKIEAVTPILSVLKEFDYIELIHNDGYRSAQERKQGKTDYEIRVSELAWSDRDPVRHPISQEQRNFYRNRGAERKTLKLQARLLLQEQTDADQK
jgi:hypothetical protein